MNKKNWLIIFVILLLIITALCEPMYADPSRSDIPNVAGSKVNAVVLTATAKTLGSIENPLNTSVSGGSVDISGSTLGAYQIGIYEVDTSGSSLGARTLDGDGNIIKSKQIHADGRGLFVTNTEMSNSGDTLGYNNIGGRWSKPVFMVNEGGNPMGHVTSPIAVSGVVQARVYSGIGTAITSTDISGEERLNVHASQSGLWDMSVNDITKIGGSTVTNPLYVTPLADGSILTLNASAIHAIPKYWAWSITQTVKELQDINIYGIKVTIQASGILPVEATGSWSVYSTNILADITYHAVTPTAGKSIKISGIYCSTTGTAGTAEILVDTNSIFKFHVGGDRYGHDFTYTGGVDEVVIITTENINPVIPLYLRFMYKEE